MSQRDYTLLQNLFLHVPQYLVSVFSILTMTFCIRDIFQAKRFEEYTYDRRRAFPHSVVYDLA